MRAEVILRLRPYFKNDDINMVKIASQAVFDREVEKVTNLIATKEEERHQKVLQLCGPNKKLEVDERIRNKVSSYVKTKMNGWTPVIMQPSV